MINLDNIDNAFFLNNLYPDGIDLKGDISEVTFSNEGPSIIISLHIRQMPTVKPKKWQPEANRVLIILEFIEVEEFSFMKWGRTNNVSVNYEEQEGLHFISIKGHDCNLNFRSKWINLKSTSSYLSE